MSSDERKIRELIANWLKSSMEGDLRTVLGLMSDDALFLLPGREPMDRQEFASAFQSGPASHRLEPVSEIKEIQVEGNMAYCWNHLSITITPLNGGAAVRRAGHILTVFKKQTDGRWLLFRDANMLTVQ
jgi:uncharacterized protein (TIGR02246 family)